MTLSYRAIHWGTGARRERKVRYHSGGTGRRVARVYAISYSTIKGAQPNVWRHEFEQVARVLEVGKRGGTQGAVVEVGEALENIGRVIDLETDKGVIVPSFWYVATDGAQERPPVVLCAADEIHVALEHAVQRTRRDPYVTPHGIEG